MVKVDVQWIDHGREPRSPPDPKYPNGIHIQAPAGTAACKVELPYPAKRCGAYSLKCGLCGSTMMVTTAGRVDDPRSVQMPCKWPRGEVKR